MPEYNQNDMRITFTTPSNIGNGLFCKQSALVHDFIIWTCQWIWL